MEMTKKKIVIKFIGGPHDGGMATMEMPYKSTINFRSSLRGDIQHIYKFDEDERNNTFPLIYRFYGYLNKF